MPDLAADLKQAQDEDSPSIAAAVRAALEKGEAAQPDAPEAPAEQAPPEPDAT